MRSASADQSDGKRVKDLSSRTAAVSVTIKVESVGEDGRAKSFIGRTAAWQMLVFLAAGSPGSSCLLASHRVTHLSGLAGEAPVVNKPGDSARHVEYEIQHSRLAGGRLPRLGAFRSLASCNS